MLLFCVIQVMVGNAKYHCACVRYLSPNDSIWIVVFGIAAAVLLVLLIVIVFSCVICCRHQRTEPGQEISAKDNQYNRRLPDEYAVKGGRQYSRELPDYREPPKQDTQYSRRLPDNYTGTTSM